MILKRIAFALLSLGLAQAQFRPTEECPILGPTFPSDFNLSDAVAVRNVITRFPQQVEALLDSGDLDSANVSFAIDVFSTATNASIYRYHYTGSAMNESLTAGVLDDNTIFRIGSTTKLFTVYAILIHAGMDILNHPVTQYLPELSGNRGKDALERIVWEDVTVGALASELGGSGSMPANVSLCWGANLTNTCSDPALISRFLSVMRDEKRPVIPSYRTAIYSDAGFGVLGRVLERLTGMPYADALRSLVTIPLSLNGTSALEPRGTNVNAIRPYPRNLTSWGGDNQLIAPSGGVYSNTADLRTLGLSILHSQLLDPVSTRLWMKPRSHTSALVFSVGTPWEIDRLTIPISATSNRTRVTDLYTKLGGQTDYAAVFVLSPDHGIGYSILLAGAGSVAQRITLRNLVGEAFVTAAEHAAAENAGRQIAGVFTDRSTPDTNITLTVDDDKPGLGIASWFYRNVDFRAAPISPDFALELLNITPTLLTPGLNISARLYPSGLTSRTITTPTNSFTNNTGCDVIVRSAYRAAAQIMPPAPRAAVEGGTGLFDSGCNTWTNVDYSTDLLVSGAAYDEFILTFVRGRVESVTNPATNSTMTRIVT